MKKNRLVVLLAALVMLCAFAFPLIHSAMAKPAPLVPAEHPEYRDAINDLRSARKHLEKAEADGYGHRDEAMRAVDHAIEHCEQAIQTLH